MTAHRSPLGRRLIVLSGTLLIGAGMATAPAGASAAAGTAWTVDPITMQASGTAELTGLDCADSAADGTCIAVGSKRGTDGSHHVLIQRRGAAGWTDVAAADPSASDAQLSAVSCSSATQCFAVGRAAYGRAVRPVLERSGAGGWRLQSRPVPTGATVAELAGISCVSATFCVAVGDAGTLTTRAALIETWDGTAWHIVASPDTGLASTKLLAVDCTSPVFCAAVGAAGASATTTTAAVEEVWNGSTWTLSTTPTGDSAELTAVDCTNSTFCLAVGDLSTFRGDYLAGERWTGTSWVAADPAVPAGFDARLHGISCASPSYCLAVGTSDLNPGLGPFARRWNGSGWVDVPKPFRAVLAVNCFAAAQCAGVGTLGEFFTASGWAVESTPYDPGAPKITRLNAVSCDGSASCLAVGQRYDNGVEVFPWSIQSHGASWDWVTDQPVGTESVRSVSCGPRSRLCLSSGYYESESTQRTLVQEFDGQSWQVMQGVPDIGPSAAVACAGSFCVVAGVREVALFDGTSWTSMPISGPNGAEVELTGVDCVSARNCVLVGGYYGSYPNMESPLVERWNGSGWRVVAAPDGPSARFNALRAVSCDSAPSCVAVGTSHGTSDTSLLLTSDADGWHATAHPATGAGLDGVACAAAGSCVAVAPNGAAIASTDGAWTRSRIAVPPGDTGALPKLTGISYADHTYRAVGSYERLGDETAVAETLVR